MGTSFAGLLDTLCLNVGHKVSESCESSRSALLSGLATLRFRCSDKGSAGAMQTRRHHGDSMGIGTQSFYLLMTRCAAEPLCKQLRELDVGWNHLDDVAMEALKSCWPEKLT